MAYPQAITADLITPGMDIEATASCDFGVTVLRGDVLTVSGEHVGFGDKMSVPTPDTAPAGVTMTYRVMTAPPTLATQPDDGAFGTDETGALWQRAGDTWWCIDGTSCTWEAFLAAGHTLTALAPVTPTPPSSIGSGYPVTIAPDDARIGMDVRVTITYATVSKTSRGIVAWNQDNAAPAADYLRFGVSTGDVIQYNPPDDGTTLLVEQLNIWTDHGQNVGVTEPATGTVLLAATEVAWQRTGTATQDYPFCLTGQGMWQPVMGEDTQPRSWIWFWGAAAPYKATS